MGGRYDIVFLGLSISSSWGNGHATTYRALLRGLKELGARVLFLERDVPWYAAHRDLPDPDFCDLELYSDLDGLEHHRQTICAASAVIIGSYVPQGREVIDRIAAWRPRLLAFYDIDTPVTMAALARGEDEFIAPRQMPIFDVYFSFSGGAVLTELETQFGVRRARALYCSVDPERYRPSDGPLSWDLGYLGTYSPDRQPTLERLLLEPARRLPDRAFVVAGANYPGDIDWPANVERIDHLPPAEHAGFYGRQRYTLNVTRADMVAAGWSPSVRLFEAAACATPIVSDRWRGLDELLPDGRAVVIADRTDDVIALLTDDDEDRRRDQARQARAIVLANHTGLARAQELDAVIRRHGRQGPAMRALEQSYA